MRSRSVAHLVVLLLIPLGAAHAQRTGIPMESAPRPTGLNVTMFTINGGVTPVADRDVTYQILFEGTSALYRVADSARSTGDWRIASGGKAGGTLRLKPGPGGSRTVYLEIKKDAISPSAILTRTVELRYPMASVSFGYETIWDANNSRSTGYTSTRTRISSSGDSCYYSAEQMSAYGVSPVLAIVTPYGLSAETVCEIKVFIGKPLRPGWTLKSVHLGPGRYAWPVSALAGSACEVHSAAFGTNSPTVSIFVKHPGSINPSSSVATHCKVHDMVFYGPADPDMPTGLFDILSPP